MTTSKKFLTLDDLVQRASHVLQDQRQMKGYVSVYAKRVFPPQPADPPDLSEKVLVWEGENVITSTMRLFVARIFAMTSAASYRPEEMFMSGEGVLLPLEPVNAFLPAFLGIGRGTTVATAQDEDLVDPYIESGESGDPLRYPLARIDVRETLSEYDDGVPFIAWEFDIPEGTLPGGGTQPIHEFGLFDGSGETLLARHVLFIPKPESLALTVRWEWTP